MYTLFWTFLKESQSSEIQQMWCISKIQMFICRKHGSYKRSCSLPEYFFLLQRKLVWGRIETAQVSYCKRFSQLERHFLWLSLIIIVIAMGGSPQIFCRSRHSIITFKRFLSSKPLPIVYLAMQIRITLHCMQTF